MKDVTLVNRIRVASPCHARWEDMDGDERARFCRQCSKHVFNLSAMTHRQIAALVREKEGKFCGRFFQRADGRMLTADCPTGLRRLRARLAGIAGACCALVVSLLGCSRSNPSSGGRLGQVLMGDVAVSPAPCPTNPPPVLMGEICVPPPPSPTNGTAHSLMGRIVVTTPVPTPDGSPSN